MKDDLLIINALGRRHLPRLLPVIILAAAAIILAVSRGMISGTAHSINLQFVFIGVFAAEQIYAWLVLRGPSSARSRYRYTVGMLKISERRAFLDCCVFNILVYLLIWASLCCAAIITGNSLYSAGAFGPSPQSFYAAYMLTGYRQLFVPMDNVPVTVSMIVMLVSLGIFSAADLAARMRGKAGSLQLLATAMLLWAFSGTGSTGSQVGFIVFAWLMFIVSCVAAWNSLTQLSRGVNEEADDGE